MGTPQRSASVCRHFLSWWAAVWLHILSFFLESLVSVVIFVWGFVRLMRKLLPPQYVDPENKAVLITGCDSGFGLELAKRLSDRGFIVFAGCLSKDSEGAELLSKYSNVHVLKLDVTDSREAMEALETVEEVLKVKKADLWAVVNNAGVAYLGETEWTSMDNLTHMFDVNVIGVVRITKTFLPLVRRCRGHLVFTGSLAGRIPFPNLVGYCMTKHAIYSLSCGLRMEMRKWGVKVAFVGPSLYKTRMTEFESLSKSIHRSWSTSSDQVREEYGGVQYLDAFLRKISYRSAIRGRSNIAEVVDCLEDAVVRLEPSFLYCPGGPFNKILLLIFGRIPQGWLDGIVCRTLQVRSPTLSQSPFWKKY